MQHEPNRLKRKRRAKDAKRPMRGYFYMKCDACDRIKVFYTKDNQEYSECVCGHRSELSGLKFVSIECKCGFKRRYRTNIQDQQFTLICRNCGAPIDVELSRRDETYYSIGEY